MPAIQLLAPPLNSSGISSGSTSNWPSDTRGYHLLGTQGLRRGRWGSREAGTQQAPAASQMNNTCSLVINRSAGQGTRCHCCLLKRCLRTVSIHSSTACSHSHLPRPSCTGVGRNQLSATTGGHALQHCRAQLMWEAHAAVIRIEPSDAAATKAHVCSPTCAFKVGHCLWHLRSPTGPRAGHPVHHHKPPGQGLPVGVVLELQGSQGMAPTHGAGACRGQQVAGMGGHAHTHTCKSGKEGGHL
jgi:hypothetical protein